MDIKILGPGCKKCSKTEKIVSAIAKELGLDATISKVTDMMEIAQHGVMSTPAVVIDGEVISTGKVPNQNQVRQWLDSAK